MPQVHLPSTPGGPASLPLVEVDSGQDLYVAKIENLTLPVGEEVPYYFSVRTAEGDDVVSDLYAFEPVASTADLGTNPAAEEASRAAID